MQHYRQALGQQVAAEAFGTFVIVLVGAATVVVADDPVATGLAFGLSLLVMTYAVGHLSGGHFNPAVSVGFAVSGRMTWPQVGVYAAAQVGGAVVAGLTLFVVLHGYDGYESRGNMGQNFFGSEAPGGFAVWAALLVEVVAAAIFVLVMLSVTDRRNPAAAVAPVVLGLGLAAIYLATSGMTGGSVNPARSIGPGLFAGTDAVLQLWLFILAPLAGAALAGLGHPLVFGRDEAPVPGSGLRLPQRPRHAAAPEAASPEDRRTDGPADGPTQGSAERLSAGPGDRPADDHPDRESPGRS
ncbi:MIP/aquaporin family protein [Nocardioides donggukensis]|uniref:Aquaporin n=1 Tax=Nocardioides donggukensis TaxID=2774019 RepID=A0A927K2S4_9ACTN|nr:aquaporin [Nocardioides donggukensis]MBD8868641.1 aquaporin [Nocardioides donggukensis]